LRPGTGEGIFFALQGAELLGDCLVAALHERRTDQAALNAYTRGRRREIESRAAFGLLLQRGLRHPRLVRTALGLLESRPDLVDVLVSVAGDYVPLRELLRPTVWRRALCPKRVDAACLA
jgi:2-polyprenyl-6-methoxyphenol hydroxylase-like FAD-dependent oxidoreductase